MMNKMTSVSLSERTGRVLAYVFGGLAIVLPFGWILSLIFGWLPLLALYFIERNRVVRWHAAQSIVTFGPLSLVMFIVSLLYGFLHGIPLLHWLTDGGLGLLLSALWWVALILAVGLAIMVWFRPRYRLPFFSSWADKLA